MRGFLVLVLRLISIVAVAAVYTSLKAQAPSESGRPSQISASIVMKQPETPVGQAPWLIVYVKNNGKETYLVDEILPHVEGEKGELPRTMYLRQRLHEPGLPGLMISGPPQPREVEAGKTAIRQFDLTKYYDISAAGKYSVYVDYQDEKGKWQRTNIVQFSMLTSAR